VLDHDPDAQVSWLPRRHSIVKYLRTILRDGDLLITMGAGDVTAIGPEYIRHMREREEYAASALTASG
jgi:UDP-N-acetylmuramate--alanine ligase